MLAYFLSSQSFTPSKEHSQISLNNNQKTKILYKTVTIAIIKMYLKRKKTVGKNSLLLNFHLLS